MKSVTAQQGTIIAPQMIAAIKKGSRPPETAAITSPDTAMPSVKTRRIGCWREAP